MSARAGSPVQTPPTPPPPKRGAVPHQPATNTVLDTDLAMGEEDLSELRKELLTMGLIKPDATEDQVRAVGERMGSWVVATSKRQRLRAKA